MMFELMGFNGKSGASSTALGSVRQYGLLDGTGDKTRISDLALAILEPSSDEEKASALRQAAEHPDVFQAIRSRFNERIPNVDEPIRAFLIREMGFQKASAEETVRSLRDTQQLAYADVPSNIPANQYAIEKVESQPISYAPVEQFTSTPDNNLIRVALTRDCFAELKITGIVTGKAISNLVRYIELMKDVWADESDEPA
jgi:hypothetical protein